MESLMYSLDGAFQLQARSSRGRKLCMRLPLHPSHQACRHDLRSSDFQKDITNASSTRTDTEPAPVFRIGRGNLRIKKHDAGSVWVPLDIICVIVVHWKPESAGAGEPQPQSINQPDFSMSAEVSFSPTWNYCYRAFPPSEHPRIPKENSVCPLSFHILRFLLCCAVVLFKKLL